MEKKLENVFRKIFWDLPDDKKLWNVIEIGRWDSITHMLLIVSIEEAFSIKIPAQEFLNCVSFYKIIEELEKIQA